MKHTKKSAAPVRDMTQGSPLATVIAQTISAVLCGAYTLRSYGDYMPRREHFRVPRETLKELASTGFAMALMITVIDAGSLVYMRANNAFGEVIITSHVTARRIISIFMGPISSVSTALSTFVGQNYGAGRKDRIRTGIIKTCLFEIGFSVVAFAVLFFSGASIVPTFGFLGTSFTEPLIWVFMAVYLVIAYAGQRKKMFGIS